VLSLFAATRSPDGRRIPRPASEDGKVRGVRWFLEAAAAELRVSTTAIHTVGGKGYDGFAVAVVTADAGEASRSASPR
jgi:hypothetical protein